MSDSGAITPVFLYKNTIYYKKLSQKSMIWNMV